jgi:HK97 family phage major capsid protein
MTLEQLRLKAQEDLSAALRERVGHTESLAAMRAALEAGDATVTEQRVDEIVLARAGVDSRIEQLRGKVSDFDAEITRDAEYASLSAQVRDGAARPSYDQVARVGHEERTYAPHRERGFDQKRGVLRTGSKPGRQFEADVINAFRGDYEAQARLQRHQAEERVERGEYLERSVGVGAFAGLVVPQYLTDLYAPAAAAGRPFADACTHHDLPPTGMTVEISRITTASSAAVQTENQAVSESNMDDTLLPVSVLTAGGQQTISRQAIERGTGIEPIVLDDLFRRYASVLDNTLLNGATNGLATVATAVTYTDASPTAAELYPKVLEALSGVEGALLDQATGQNIAVMHSRRWYWMQSQVGTSFPFLSQAGIPALAGGTVDPGAGYGSGRRGTLPNGTAVIVDNNIATNLGGGAEDEIYVGDKGEFHLWEDSNAPMFIRAEQTNAATLGVLLVVYGYFAYTHARYAHARRIGGTGTTTPSF